MTPDRINGRVIVDRIAWVQTMVARLKALPLRSKDEFLGNPDLVAAAESYLRRALEALFDLGRHILAKKFALPASEYKDVASGLANVKLLDKSEADLLAKMAGYRNRMVHLYHEIGPEELHQIALLHADDILLILDRIKRWAQQEIELPRGKKRTAKKVKS